MRLYRVIVPVRDIEAAARFYGTVLGGPGERISSGRHYFDCGGTILALLDALADTEPEPLPANHGNLYLSTDEPLDEVRRRALEAGAEPDEPLDTVARRPWGEVSFYFRDPWGNPVSIVQAGSEYLGGALPPPG
jgi:catechol 2,3-dioxygenase-like lactoylglutathione lyase family enzyme